MGPIEPGVEGKPWTRHEVEAVVGVYLHMLRMQLMGQSPNKAEHNRQLRSILPARSAAAIEYKHSNISAVLLELGVPPLIGYKPYFHYQRLLQDVITESLQQDRALDEAALQQVETPAEMPLLESLDQLMVPVPSCRAKPMRSKDAAIADRPVVMRDYLEREARNRSLGRAGEALVMKYEARRLHSAGAKALADRIEHISLTKGDGAGFDILSFEADGRERFIEVKTTAYIAETPFFVSRNELAFSTEKTAQFQLYRLFDFRKEPHMFALEGAIDGNCVLDPTSYRATVKMRD